MREIRTSGLMSGDGKRATASRSRTAPVLDSTESAGCRFAVIGSVDMPTCCVIDQRTDDRVSAGQKLMLWVGASWRAWQ